MKGFLALCLSVAAFAASPVTSIKVDQVGYLPDAPKIALVVTDKPASKFVVRSVPKGAEVFRSELSPPLDDPDSGDRVQVADFSKLAKPGKYFIDIPDLGRSWDFEIRGDVYSRAYYLAMRSYYGQRCGTDVDLGPEFPGFKYAACHQRGEYHASSGKTGPAKSEKGWHDAGDYGRYVVNSGITTGTLLWAWEMFGDKIRTLKLNIPESSNKTPDILDEIRWNLDWMLTMQDEDGGVWHKQTSERFAPFVMPERDASVSYVIGSGKEPFKTTCSTADFAAVMAAASRAFKPFDPAYSKRTLEAARNAWNWAEQHPDVLYSNPQAVATGAYGDRNCSDEMLWAAAELSRTTGEAAYAGYFNTHYSAILNAPRSLGPPSWASVGPLALWSYVLSGKKDEAAAVIRTAVIKAADEIVTRTAANPYRVSLTKSDYVWGSNGVVSNYGMQLLVANALRPDPRYTQAANDNLHYLLGRNTHSLSFVTQLGAHPFRHPHHRPSGADSNAEPWPGLLSGGPCARRADPAMRKLPDLPPAKMYLDEQESYATNEIAINWNAPLVYLLAGLLPR